MSEANGGLAGMVGRHPLMRALWARVRQVAPRDVSVLVVGETGTGKELIAQALHSLSPRGGRALVALNCAAIPDTLAEAELFGAEAGAYTGARRTRPGALAQAHRTTLFLDEIDSASPALQAKLLRATECRQFRRLGSAQVERSDFRLVAASARSPDSLIAAGTLRGDLYYRLTCVLAIPPLRERTEDIALLAEHFMSKLNGSGAHKSLDRTAVDALRAHQWPGNVRELKRAVEVLVTFVEGPVITGRDVERELHLLAQAQTATERERLVATLEAHGWNATATARTLGCGRSTLYRKLRRHGIQRGPADGT
jgi:transcriptional regulator with PAS, ATPase and Fis domain